jgi:hypothetical protein
VAVEFWSEVEACSPKKRRHTYAVRGGRHMRSVGNAVILKEEETCLDNYQGEEFLTHKEQGTRKPEA